jgi:glucokinase
MILPVDNPTKSYWIEAAESPLRDHRTTEELPEKTDVLIVGGGYTGMSVAYWLTRVRVWRVVHGNEAHKQYTPNPPSISLFEARGISTGASGRNG